MKMTMRKMLAVLATLAVLCTVLPLGALFSAVADGDNLFVNGDFETGTADGWNTWQGTEIIADAANNGEYGAHLVGNGSWGGMLDQTIAVTAGAQYKLSFWINVNAVGANVQVKDGAGNSIEGAGGWFDANKKNHLVEWTFTATDDTVFVNFCGGGTGAAEDLYVDDFSLVSLGGETPSEPAGDNIIPNGDFAENVDGWYASGNSSVEWQDGALHATYGDDWGFIGYNINVKANTNYILTFDAKSINGGGISPKMNKTDWSGTVVSTDCAFGADWDTYTWEFNSGDHTAFMLFFQSHHTAADGQQIWLDNISLVELAGGDEPVAPAETILNATFDGGETDGILSSSDIAVEDGALKFTVTKDWGNIYTELAVEANTDYVVSFKAKSELGKSFWVKFHKADWTGDIVQADLSMSKEWKEYSYTLNSGDNTSLWLLVQFAGYAAEGEIAWFDYITVSKVGGSTPDPDPTPDVPTGNVLVNGGFEDGSNGWELSSSATIVDDAHTGNAALQLTDVAMWSGAAMQTVPVAPNTDYVIKMWVKRDVGTKSFNLFVMNGETNANLTVVEGQNWFNTADSSWTERTIVVNTGDATSMTLKWSAEVANDGVLLVDDMEVYAKVDTPVPPSATGLVVNGDFETGDASGWETWQSTSISEEAAHGGKYGAYLVGNGGWGGLLNQTMAVENGETYTITLWVFINGGSSGVNLQIKGADKVEGECDNTYLDPAELSGWQLRKFNVVANSDEITLNFCGGGTGKAEDIYIDDITLVKKGESPSGDDTSPIKNAGFESGEISPWKNLWDACTYSVEAGGYNKSNYALNYEAAGQWQQIRQDMIPVEPNTDYVVVGYVKNPLNVNIVVKTGDDTANINEVAIENDFSNKWIRAAVEFNTGDLDAICVLLISREAGASAIWDDVQVYVKGTEPTDVINDEEVTEGPIALDKFGVAINRPVSADKNLILNGSFENDEESQWQSVLGDTLYVVDDETAPNGDKSLYFNTTGVEAGDKTVFYVDVEPETDYVFSAWVKGAFISDDNRFNATLGVVDYKNNFAVYGDHVFSNKNRQIVPTCWDNEWHLRSVQFNSGANSKVGIGFAGGLSQMWVDDIALFKVDDGIKYADPRQIDYIYATGVYAEEGFCADENNLLPDSTMSGADSEAFWSTGEGYKNGFLTFAENKYEYGTSLKYTESSNPSNTYAIKWIEVKPNTDYTFSVDMRVVKDGYGKLALLDGKKRDCYGFLMVDFDKTNYGADWFTIAAEFNTGEFDRIGIAVVDGGGVALFDNMRLFETTNRVAKGESVDYVKPPYAFGSTDDPHYVEGIIPNDPESPDTGVSVVGAALALALVPSSAVVAFKLRRKKEDEE